MSPAIRAMLTPDTRICGIVQLPIYQRINSAQETADWAASMGIRWQL